MNIIVSLFTTYFLYRTLFSAPIDAPNSFFTMITRQGIATEDRFEFKQAWIRFGIFFAGFIILGAIQAGLMDLYAPQRSDTLNEISMTVLSGQDFNVFLTLLKLVAGGLFGAFSLSTIFATLIINLLYLAALTALFYFTDITTEFFIPIIKPFERPLVLGVTLIILFIYSMVTYDESTPFFQAIFKCVWEFVDTVHLQSCLATCIACAATNDIVKVAVLATGHSSNINPIDRF